MNDGALYTGVDEDPTKGIFENEQVDTATKEMLDEERKKRAEITPVLEDLLKQIDTEIGTVNSIKRFKAAASQPEADIRSELQAAALYEDYLTRLKTKFTLALAETKK